MYNSSEHPLSSSSRPSIMRREEQWSKYWVNKPSEAPIAQPVRRRSSRNQARVNDCSAAFGTHQKDAVKGPTELGGETSASERPDPRRTTSRRRQAKKNIEQSISSPRPAKEQLENTVEKPRAHSSAFQFCKRQVDDSAEPSSVEPPAVKRARLTVQNLAEFTRMAVKKKPGKAPASDVSPLDSVPAQSTISSVSGKSLSTTKTGFANEAVDNGVLLVALSTPPMNLSDLKDRLAQARDSPQPEEADYTHYVKTVGRVADEQTLLVETCWDLLKKYRDGCSPAFDRAFTGYPQNIGFNDGLSPPQPDFVQGLELPQFMPFPIRRILKCAVLYADDPFSLVLPHLAGEWKGPGKNMVHGAVQCAYDGAALVHARNEALSYLGISDLPSNAVVITFSTDGSALNFFAHYASEGEDGRMRHHQSRISTFLLDDSHQAFKDGRRALRNAQDFARENSHDLRRKLNEHWSELNAQSATEGPAITTAGEKSGKTSSHEAEKQQAALPTPSVSDSLPQTTPPSGSVASGSHLSGSLPSRSQRSDGSRGRKRKASPGAKGQGKERN